MNAHEEKFMLNGDADKYQQAMYRNNNRKRDDDCSCHPKKTKRYSYNYSQPKYSKINSGDYYSAEDTENSNKQKETKKTILTKNQKIGLAIAGIIAGILIYQFIKHK